MANWIGSSRRLKTNERSSTANVDKRETIFNYRISIKNALVMFSSLEQRRSNGIPDWSRVEQNQNTQRDWKRNKSNRLKYLNKRATTTGFDLPILRFQVEHENEFDNFPLFGLRPFFKLIAAACFTASDNSPLNVFFKQSCMSSLIVPYLRVRTNKISLELLASNFLWRSEICFDFDENSFLQLSERRLCK